MTKRDVAAFLIGVMLTCGGFGVRDAIRAFTMLSERVDYMSGYLSQLDQLIKGNVPR